MIGYQLDCCGFVLAIVPIGCITNYYCDLSLHYLSSTMSSYDDFL